MGDNSTVPSNIFLGLVLFVCPILRSLLNGCHVGTNDTKLNSIMRIISDTVKSSSTQWLPDLCGIAPPDLQCKQALHRGYRKALAKHKCYSAKTYRTGPTTDSNHVNACTNARKQTHQPTDRPTNKHTYYISKSEIKIILGISTQIFT